MMRYNSGSLSRNNFRYHDYFFITSLFLVSFWFQSHVYFNWDASWHLEAAKRILQGGASYSKNLYDDNLPMVFWYFIPAVLLHKITGIFIITAALISIHCSVFLCFILCHLFLKQIYQPAKYWHVEIIRYGLLLSLLFFPGEEFGQRDMMVVTLVLPYCFLIAARLTTQLPQNKYVCIFLGLLAAMGIAMNPFYGLIMVALEIQLWFFFKKITVIRPESITFAVILFIYLLLIQSFYPDYYTQIIPSYLIFSPDYNVNLWGLIKTLPFMGFLFSTLIYFLYRHFSEYKSWLTTLWLTLFSACVVYLINGKLYQSHIIFLTIVNNLFFLVILSEVFAKKSRWIFAVPACIALLLTACSAKDSNVSYYHYSQNAANVPAKLLTWFLHHAQSNSNILILSTHSFPMIQLSFYAKLNNISPWSSCWTIRSIAQSNRAINQLPTWKKVWIEKYKKIFIDQVATVLKVQRPEFVLVNVRKNQGNMKGFSYIHFLANNKTFQQSWKNYRLIKIISHYQIFFVENKN